MTTDNDDKNIWQIVKNTIKPLKKVNVYKQQKQNKKTSEKLNSKSKQTPILQGIGINVNKPKTTINLKPQQIGDTDRLNKSHAKKLKSRTLNIEMTLDLHGHTQNQAHQELDNFMARAIQNNCATVKIITGKGKGILQNQVPKWLNEYDNVLSVVHAPQKYGGTGALVIALKRKKS